MKSKFNTYFFKEYEGIAEKNTFSTYIPEEGKGLWCLVVDSEIDWNFAKIAVENIVKDYFENSEISYDNMTNILISAKKRIYERKIVRNKNVDNPTSVLVVMAENDEMIVGNLGNTKLKVFRDNVIIEEISGDDNRIIKLEKNDYILMGTSKFWKIINEDDISDTLIRWNSKNEIEKYLSDKIRRAEKNEKITIPFLSIFAQNIAEKEIEYVPVIEKQKNPLKYLLLALITSMSVIAIGKTTMDKKYENLATQYTVEGDKHLKDKEFNKSINKFDLAILEYNKIKPKNKKVDEKIEDLEKKKQQAKKEEEEEILAQARLREQEIKAQVEIVKPVEIKVEEPVVKKVEEPVAEEVAKPIVKNKIEKKKVIQKPKKEENPKDKKTEVKKQEKIIEIKQKQQENSKPKQVVEKTKKVKPKKSQNNNGLDDLEREIQRNWKILGRDKNGNKIIQ